MTTRTETPEEAARSSLLWAWFEAHPNQPMPEGRSAVGSRLALIQREARTAALDEVEAAIERLYPEIETGGHYRSCNAWVFSGGEYPADPCSCGGPELRRAIASLREDPE